MNKKIRKRCTLFVAILVLFVVQGCAVEIEQIDYAERYQGREKYFTVEYEDYFSHLLCFPELDYTSMEVVDYSYEYEAMGFDSKYFIFLEYKLNEDEYILEKERVKDIQIQYDNLVNNIKVLDYKEMCEVYLLSWWENRAYEYAIFDDDECSVVCIYSQLEAPSLEKIEECYLLENDDVKAVVEENFSIYYFQRDDGNYVLPELNGDDIKSTLLK